MAYFLCEPGGAAEKVILDSYHAANAWRVAARQAASAAFKREIDGMLVTVGRWFWVPILEGEEIPKGWVLDKRRQHERAPHGLAIPTARTSRALKLPRVLMDSELGEALFGECPAGPPEVSGSFTQVYTPGWEKLGEHWIVLVRDDGAVRAPAGSRRIRDSEYWLMKEAQESAATGDAT
jgi:hypothetical protein